MIDSSRQRRALLRSIGALAFAGCVPIGLPLGRAQSVGAEVESLAHIDDLRPVLAQVRRDRVPLLLFFSTPGCPYCREVRRSYLAPRVREGRAAGVAIREVDITARRRLIGADGQKLTESEVAASFDIHVAPVVVLVDDRLRPLADPLIGLDRAGFYEGYLTAAIEAARAKLEPK